MKSPHRLTDRSLFEVTSLNSLQRGNQQKGTIFMILERRCLTKPSLIQSMGINSYRRNCHLNRSYSKIMIPPSFFTI